MVRLPVTLNRSGTRATEFNVLVKPDKVEEVTPGGIIKPQMALDRQQAAAMMGQIVHVSPLAFTFERWPDDGESKPKVGDRVRYAKYAGMAFTGNDGEIYILMKDKDIAGICD